MVLFVYLSWVDPRAASAVSSATAAAMNSSTCAFPCTTIYVWAAKPNGNNNCCDRIWLPHFEFVSARGFSQDRIVRYGVRLGPGDSVGWWAHVQMEGYTPFEFRAFPFDKCGAQCFLRASGWLCCEGGTYQAQSL